jgi:chemotaxis protein CheC
MVMVYLGVEPPAAGHVLLALSEPAARDLIDLLLGQAPGTTATLGDLEISALAEAGNVAGSAFLGALADRAGLRLLPRPPAVFHEMFGALLDTLGAALMALGQDEVLWVESTFRGDGQVIEVWFLMFSEPALTGALVAAAEQEAAHAGR